MPFGSGMDRGRARDHQRAHRHYEEDDEEDEEDEEEDEEESPAGSRRSLRRDLSPRSAHHYRSTPESRKDSRPSVPESDGESDITVSTQDGRRHRALERHGQLQRRPRYTEPDDYLDQRDDDRRWRRRHRRGTIVYDVQDEEDATPHQSVIEHKSPARHQSRQSSRQSSDLVGSSSSVRRGHHSRSQSVLEAPTPPRTRPTRRRHSQVIYTEEVPPTLRRAHTASETHVTSHSTTSSNRRRSLLGNFFGPGIQGHASGRPVKRVSCLICMDDLPATKAARLKCGHRMCSSCLKDHFKLSIRDPQKMPPKCCSEVIELKHVDPLFSSDFKKMWNSKFAEFSTRKRVYCPGKRCGEWIKPANIHREDGRKCGKCSRCKLKVCCACNGKWHGSRECPRDEETTLFLEQAKDAGWQRCHRCKAMVELKEGCNHMTCRCGAEFCMICGLKWKTCECPWFNHETHEDDDLEDMYIPPSLGRDRLGMIDSSPPSRRAMHPVPDLGPPMPMRQRAPDHYEDPLMRRLQERQDSDLARRLHVPDEDGDMSPHHRSDDHRRRARHAPVPAPPPPSAPPVGFERASATGEYVAGVNRARGVRQDSVERRLADRLSEFRSSPGSRGGMQNMMMPPPPPPPGSGHPLSMHASSVGVPTMRMSAMEEELMYNSRGRGGWPSGPDAGMMMPGGMGGYAQAPPPPAPVPEPPAELVSRVRRRAGEPKPSTTTGEPKSSTMAGLTGEGRGMGRVFEWRNHVEPGVPGDERQRG
ncbi:hypothetical protein ACHAQA_005391 [Verticillium albo-atrum]